VRRSQRGLKASDVTVVGAQAQPPTTLAQPTPVGSALDDGLIDVVSTADYTREVTDILIGALPLITASEIVGVRQHLCEIAARHSWLED
jgi:hypothetical protein